VTKIYDYQC